MRLSKTGQKWLKVLHLVTASSWLAGALTLVLLHTLRFSGVESGQELYGIDRAAHLVDIDVVVLLGAMGCLLTGLLYSWLTGWGFFKHGWVICKWGITVFGILFGTFFLGPWEKGMLDVSHALGDLALQDAVYLQNMRLNFWFGIMQLGLLATAVWLSVFKPWKYSRPGKTGDVRDA